MAACAIDTAIRNSVASGGSLSNIAILDNFCWCSSYDQKRLGQLVEAVRACYDYAVGFGTPFISGKDSMFNDFKGYDEKGNPVAISIPPTLLISAISVVPDLNKTVSPEFKNIGDVIYIIGETNDELGGGEYFKILGATGNNVPKVSLKKNIKAYQALERVIQKEIINSSISVTSGGLAIALAKASVGGMLGCNISIKNLMGNAKETDIKLFSESQGRILVSVSPKNIKVFEKIMTGNAITKIGKVTKDSKFIITDKTRVVDTEIKNLYKIYHNFSNKMK
jgi:phosphoribosylformylglycinamidine synthase